MYLDNDPGVLISACLFGDGAGAAVLSAQVPHQVSGQVSGQFGHQIEVARGGGVSSRAACQVGRGVKWGEASSRVA